LYISRGVLIVWVTLLVALPERHARHIYAVIVDKADVSIGKDHDVAVLKVTVRYIDLLQVLDAASECFR